MKTIVENYNGAEQTVNSSIVSEICDIIENINFNLHKYMIKEFRAEIPLKLKEHGWPDNIYLDSSSKINITSMKNQIGLCVQTGNVSRIYADLLKLQSMYAKSCITGGIIVLPTSTAAKSFGGNIASLERLERELSIFNDVITLPLVLIGFYE